MASNSHSVESLVHVRCSFTKAQLVRLTEAGWRGAPQEIALITYLGSDNHLPERPYLLFRFYRGVYSAPHCPEAFTEAFGSDYQVLYGNEALASEWRVLVTLLPSERHIKDAPKFLGAQARKFAEALTKALVLYDASGEWSQDPSYVP